MKVSKVTNPLTQPLKPQLTSSESNLPTKSDLTLFIRKYITNHWISLWQKKAPSNELAQIKSLPLSRSSSHQTHRRHQFYLTRLRIGHTRITHAHLLSNLFPLPCKHCSLDSPMPCPHSPTIPSFPQSISLQQLLPYPQRILLPPCSKLLHASNPHSLPPSS